MLWVLTVDLPSAGGLTLAEGLDGDLAAGTLAQLRSFFEDGEARLEGWRVIEDADGFRASNGTFTARFRLQRSAASVVEARGRAVRTAPPAQAAPNRVPQVRQP